MNPTASPHDRSLRRGMAAFFLIAAVVVAQAPLTASAATAPTVVLDDGGDGFVNADESTQVFIEVSYNPADVPPVTYAEGRIVGTTSGAPCLTGAPYTTANQSSIVDLGGSFRIGPFDVSGFPEGAELCGRAFVRDAANGQSTSSVSNTAILDTEGPVAGTVEMIESFIVDGYLNRAETLGQCCIAANWDHPDPADVAAARVWFVDSTDAITSGCGPWSTGPTGFGNVNASCAQSMEEGTFSFRGQWEDAAGNLSSEATATLIKDSVRPDVTFDSPAPGSAFAPGSTVNVQGTTEPLSSLQFRLDGSVIGTGDADGTGVFSFSFAAPAALGSHTFRAIATDLASNTRGRNLAFEVDDLVPVILLPVTGAVESGAVTFTGTGRPVADLELYEGATLIGSTTIDSNGDWVIVAGMTDGNHTVTAVAIDGSSTSDPSAPVTFTVDAGRPTVAIETADNSPFLGSPVVVSGTAGDGAEGVASIRVSYFNLAGTRSFSHDAACTGCGAGATSVAWQSDPVLPVPGIYTVVAQAVDATGNVSLASSIRIIVVSP